MQHLWHFLPTTRCLKYFEHMLDVYAPYKIWISCRSCGYTDCYEVDSSSLEQIL
jgi:predicted nucleic-acid-binding Zn-ribbon protein